MILLIRSTRMVILYTCLMFDLNCFFIGKLIRFFMSLSSVMSIWSAACSCAFLTFVGFFIISMRWSMAERIRSRALVITRILGSEIFLFGCDVGLKKCFKSGVRSAFSKVKLELFTKACLTIHLLILQVFDNH